MTVTSAMKGLAPTVNTLLQAIIIDDKFADYGGKIDNLGLVSADPEENYDQLPTASTQCNHTYTADDYTALVADMYSGKITVSNDVTAAASDFATTVTVNDLGNIK